MMTDMRNDTLWNPDYNKDSNKRKTHLSSILYMLDIQTLDTNY